ncbi:MAG: hypothetical protein A2X64_06490 [Ignavibacteria bacterium GWF2_33_9]|nr:MAG: hypothetical protein A2X64_06490 [Ignavibacteria bacterium GWF2_33_9]
MLVIPSLDIKNGKVIDLIKYSNEFDYYYKELSEVPMNLCKLWRSENAKTLHINDLYDENHTTNIDTIIEILDCLDIPITLSSMSNSIDVCELYLKKGILRVAVCQFLLDNPKNVKELIEKYSANRIIFYALVKNNFLSQWGYESQITIQEYIEKVKEVDGKRIIFGDLDWNDNNEKINFNNLEDIFLNSGLKITLQGGVRDYSDFIELKKYEKLGIDSVIISKPLYENNFPCQEIWRIAETS